ncbi:MAG: AEC family transporter [Ruminococcaceae bacterium]|nr:AEC family transporter [Oscillospiraceae bacterium]
MLEALLFAIEAVFPIILMVALGFLLKKKALVDASFIKKANKLVFRLFLPVMLFNNIYGIKGIGELDLGYAVFVALFTVVLFCIMIPVVRKVSSDNKRRGALLQASFRSNYALIGIPLAQALFGFEGVAVASLLSAVLIPVFNVLAVLSLSIFTDSEPSVKRIVKDIVKNPLINAVLLGVVVLVIREFFNANLISFRLSDIGILFKIISYLSSVATPLALLMLGAQFEFSAIRELKREIFFGTLTRTLIVPFLGLLSAYLLYFFNILDLNGAHFASFVAAFSTPVAVSSVPMAQEMKSDVVLAGQLVVWTTLISSATVFASAFVLKVLGVF